MTITSAAAVLFFLMGLLIITDAFVPISQQSHRSLELFASSTISPFNSRRQEVSSSLDVRILEPIGNGTFGGVYFAEDAITGDKLIAKTARAAISDETAQQNAKSYLEIEAYINTKLYHESEQHNIYQQHVAPYLGEIEINHTMFLLWKTSGEYTLEDYIEIDDGWVQLAKDLGVEEEVDRSMFHQKFAREILRQLLEGLAYCHSKGVIHRDIKPANVLVDPKTKTLRLIDFGSSCDMSSWTSKAGYRGQNKGPRSILYCAPEEFVNEECPYAFDVYGVTITWLRTVLSEDRLPEDKDNTQESLFGLGDEEQLFQWRLAVRDFSHNIIAWEEYAVLHNTLPFGWDSLFGSSREGIYALRLLSRMMSYTPAKRICASEALLCPYLNPDCSVEITDLPPALPWSLMSHIQRWKKERVVQYGECRLEDLFTEVVVVELHFPLGLVFEKQRSNRGAMVTGIDSQTDANELGVREGDSLLAIGSIDVENASLEHVNELLDQWPREKSVPLILLRDCS